MDKFGQKGFENVRVGEALELNAEQDVANERADQKEDEMPDAEKSKKTAKSSPELIQKYIKEGEELLNSFRRFFIVFAKDTSLDFRIADGFRFDFKNGIVSLDAKWFAERNCSRDQILWAVMHELAHFRDFVDDPEGLMKGFDYMMDEAKKTGAVMMKKWEEKYEATDPQFIETIKKQKPLDKKDPNSRTMNAVEMAAYKFHHTFYNVFDDIYVNRQVERMAPKYKKGSKGGGEIRDLYKNVLFKGGDYASLPRHLQFLYKLIREEMVDDEETVVSDEIKGVLEQEIMLYGKKYTAEQIVEQFLKPRLGRDAKSSHRQFILRKTLEPIFYELLAKDLEEWDPKKREEQVGGGRDNGGEEAEREERGEESRGDREDEEGGDEEESGEGGEEGDANKEDEIEANPFGDYYQEQGENNLDKISDKEVKDWLNQRKEDKKNEAKEEQAGRGKRKETQKEMQGRLDREWCDEQGIDYKTFLKFREIEKEIEPYLKELAELWREIIYGSSRQIGVGMEGHFKTGSELDVQKTIEEWPDIATGNYESVRIMRRMGEKEASIEKPELIRVRLVGDMSGSMDEDDGIKLHVLQQCFVLILSSLWEFNIYLNQYRKAMKSKLKAETEAWVFENEAGRVKELGDGSRTNEERAAMMKILENLEETGGSTYDNKALNGILASLTSEDKEKINKKKIMDIVFEITDGGSSNQEGSKEAVNALLETGIIARAFQIGDVSEGEKEIFDFVWNNDRRERLGEVVGSDIANLLPAVVKVLKKYLSNVQL